ncbi:MAG TPA: phenylalanine--tRNA ligase subunit beta [Anaeromyxobacteraceae bacterium]|nr:phenylalanine--tRNA ligase subunit beta [Anaeromyxobacteraceae bacterium]
MRVSLNWLREYVPVPSVEELAQRLTAVGLEVEAVERVGAELDGVVAARIVAAERHPQADRLSVTQVDAGAGPVQVVCGATNWKVGDVVALAAPGAVLPGGQRIERARLRGVESHGMLCSAKELGLSEESSGLLLLPPDAALGEPLARVLGLEDTVLEVNVTPNRPDALSHVGIAREVAAALGGPLHPPEAGLVQRPPAASALVRVRVEAPDRCFRYAARVIEGVKDGPSPAWLARRLGACGVRSISAIVDATNFVLLEQGHPLHAFDLDKVAGAEIVVRLARSGEKLVTLDGQERSLFADDLVIADRDHPSALAGVMGGAHSEISPGTTRVLLESAWFEPTGVRRTARRHGLHTEASHRFERGVDPAGVTPALDRCAALIAELAGGVVRRGAADAYPRRRRPVDVALAWSRPGEILGMPVSRGEARRTLAAFGFEERKATPRGAVFRVPSWRLDVTREEDLVEEIVRLKGYDAIPETLPAVTSGTPAASRDAQVADRIRTALETAGFSEAVNFSFVAPAELAALSPGSGARPGIALKNPISAELAVMRTSLVPSLLKDAAHNLRQRVEDVRLYELASVYHVPSAGAGGDAPAHEELRVAGVAMGRRHAVGWATGGDPVDFYDLKAAVESVLDALGIESARFGRASEPWLHPRSAAAVTAPGVDGGLRTLGVAGELHPRTAAAFELPRGVLAFELSFGALAAAARLVPAHADVPRFPAVLRDLAVVVGEGVEARTVLDLVREEALAEEVSLFDVYRGVPIPAGKKNLAMAIRYRAPDRTLTDAEADAAHGRIVDRLRAEVGAELRA